MTIDQMRAALVAQYAPILHDPVITISVATSSASRVFIGGEVQSPGEFGFTGRGTLSQYLTKAGGLKESGAGGDILLIRRGPDFGPHMGVLNAAAVFSGRNAGEDIELRPYDVVYVPPTPIAQLDRLSDQYIRQIVPISFNYLF
jgi:protein involved in polysaccharide export with SLBB domain